MQIAKNIANIALAFLIVGSTLGVTLHKHHCMGHVRNVAFMHQADPCMGEMDMDMPEGCCKDTVEEFKVDDLNKTTFSFDVTPELFLLSVLDYVLLDTDLESRLTSQTAFLNYKPPLIEHDIPLSVQSFLL